jgi:periplasmic protein TonB
MRRVRAACAPWLGSLLLHGALVAAALPCSSSVPPGDDAALDVVSLEEIIEPDQDAVEPGPGGGGTEGGSEGGGDVAAPEPASATESAPPRRAAPERQQPARPAPPDVAAISSATARAGTAPGAGRGDGGRGGGVGGGIGAGRGPGSGGVGPGRGARAPSVRATRPPRSKARPPRLVYPRRDREERPGEVFVVLLTVNEKGYVVGVRLKQGVSRDRDEKALEAVWRFHYDPALDHLGRPIEAQVVQRFMVE